jgi:hypothetical protein
MTEQSDLKTLLGKLLENPLLSLATTILALLALLNTIVGSFGLSPFWSDVVICLFLVYTTFRWGRIALSGIRRRETIPELDGTRHEVVSYRTLFVRSLSPIVVIVILVLLLSWNAVPVLRQAREANWSVCGSFLKACNSRVCLKFTDSRGRPVSAECLSVDDDSGYKNFTAPNWRAYRPKRVVVVCEGTPSEPVELDQSFFDATCEGRIER